MIKPINSIEDVKDFALSFSSDIFFSDPMLSNEEHFKNNLIKSINTSQKYDTFGVYEDERITGLFSFLRLADEHYLEMIVGLSKEKAAYDEMIAYLFEHYNGYNADFVFNPKNFLLSDILKKNGAEFDPEQYKMLLKEPALCQSNLAIVPYSDDFMDGYMAIHNDEGRYWTAEKVIAAPERFRILLALKDNEVAGYIDVTNCFEENEPVDLFVTQKYRRMGFGRALLMRAIELNAPNKMMLLVNTDNISAINLYKSMGFEIDELGGSVTASLKIR